MADAFWIVVLVLATLGALAVAYALWGRRSFAREDLRERFGPEYDRAVEETGSGKAARRELRRRVKRVERLDLRALDRDERARFVEAWNELEARFVDDPVRATGALGRLIDDVMVARGFDVDDPDRQLDDLSVESPTAAGHARAAEALMRPGASTEDLRRATVHYRAVFDALLQAPAHGRPASELPREDLV
jgi:hypothetical protein